MSAFDLIVIGGGLHGLSAALHLARAGRRVAIAEKSFVGRHASGATAAGVRTLNRALEELPIAFEAMAMWRNMHALVGDDCGFHPYGQVRVAERVEHVPELERRLETSRRAGFHHEELIDRDELRRLVPALAPHCVAALVVRTDGAADPHRTLAAFRRSAEAEGVTIVERFPVEAIERRDSLWRVRAGHKQLTAPVVINAAGAWAGSIASMVGDEFVLRHKASMMMVTERTAPLLKPVVSVVGRPLSFKQTDQGTLVIGGGIQGRADVAAEKSHVDFAGLAKSARAVADLFPQITSLRVVRSWTGIEAKTGDLLPVIGASPQAGGIFHVFGFSGHGFQLVPVVGAIMADLVVRGGSHRNISGFQPERLIRSRAAA